MHERISHGCAIANNLIWIDMEMTGLQPDTDRIIEIAMLVTDPQLNVIADGPVLVVHQPDAVLDAMDSWNKSTHAKIRPDRAVRASTLTEAEAERQALAFLAAHVPRERLADVRQLDLPGPALPRALDAAARGVLPLPQPRRLDAEGAGAALEARV